MVRSAIHIQHTHEVTLHIIFKGAKGKHIIDYITNHYQFGKFLFRTIRAIIFFALNSGCFASPTGPKAAVLYRIICFAYFVVGIGRRAPSKASLVRLDYSSEQLY